MEARQWCGGRKKDLGGGAVQMDCIRGLLGTRRTGRIPNARVTELCGRRLNGLTKVLSGGPAILIE